MIDVQPTVTRNTTGPRMGNERDVYEHQVSLIKQMEDALASGQGSDYLALRQAYDATANASPDVMHYLTRVSTLEQDSSPRRAAMASQALIAPFERKMVARGYKLDVFTDPRYDTAQKAKWNVDGDTAMRLARQASGADVSDDERALAANELKTLNSLATRASVTGGVASTQLAGAEFKTIKDLAMTHAKADYADGMLSPQDRYGTAFDLARAARISGTPAEAAYDAHKNVLDLVRKAYEGTKTTDIPWSAINTTATKTVLSLMDQDHGIPPEAMSRFSKITDALNRGTASLNIMSPADVPTIVTKLRDAAVTFDDTTLNERAVDLQPVQKQQASESLMYLDGVDNGLFKADPEQVSMHKDRLRNLGLDDMRPSGGISDKVEQRATMTDVPYADQSVRDVSKLIKKPLAPSEAQTLVAGKQEQIKASNALANAKRLFSDARVDEQTMGLLGGVAQLMSGKASPDQSKQVLAYIKTNQPLQQAMAARPELKKTIDELTGALEVASRTVIDTYAHSTSELGRQAALKAGIDKNSGILAAMKAERATNDEVFGLMFPGGQIAGLRALVSEAKNLVTGGLAGEGWKDTVREMIRDNIAQSSAPIKSLGGVTLGEWSKAMTADDWDRVYSAYSQKLGVSLAKAIPEDLALLAVGESAVASVGARAVSAVPSLVSSGVGAAKRLFLKAAGKETAETAAATTAGKQVGSLAASKAMQKAVEKRVAESMSSYTAEELGLLPGVSEATKRAAVEKLVRQEMSSKLGPMAARGLGGAALQGLSALGASGTSWNRPAELLSPIVRTTDRYIKGNTGLEFNYRLGSFSPSGKGTFDASRLAVLEEGKAPLATVDGKPYDVSKNLLQALVASIGSGTDMDQTKALGAIDQLQQAAQYNNASNEKLQKLSEGLGVSRNILDAAIEGKTAVVNAAASGVDIPTLANTMIKRFPNNQNVIRYWSRELQRYEDSKNSNQYKNAKLLADMEFRRQQLQQGERRLDNTAAAQAERAAAAREGLAQRGEMVKVAKFKAGMPESPAENTDETAPQ